MGAVSRAYQVFNDRPNSSDASLLLATGPQEEVTGNQRRDDS